MLLIFGNGFEASGLLKELLPIPDGTKDWPDIHDVSRSLCEDGRWPCIPEFTYSLSTVGNLLKLSIEAIIWHTFGYLCRNELHEVSATIPKVQSILPGSSSSDSITLRIAVANWMFL